MSSQCSCLGSWLIKLKTLVKKIIAHDSQVIGEYMQNNLSLHGGLTTLVFFMNTSDLDAWQLNFVWQRVEHRPSWTFDFVFFFFSLVLKCRKPREQFCTNFICSVLIQHVSFFFFFWARHIIDVGGDKFSFTIC